MRLRLERLAEWMGKCLHVYGDNLTPDPLPKGVQFVVYHPCHGGGDVQSVARADGSSYRPDADPAAALELLEWIRSQEKSVQRQFQTALQQQWRKWCLSKSLASDRWLVGYPWWLLFHAGLDAIAKAADEVRKGEGN